MFIYPFSQVLIFFSVSWPTQILIVFYLNFRISILVQDAYLQIHIYANLFSKDSQLSIYLQEIRKGLKVNKYCSNVFHCLLYMIFVYFYFIFILYCTFLISSNFCFPFMLFHFKVFYPFVDLYYYELAYLFANFVRIFLSVCFCSVLFWNDLHTDMRFYNKKTTRSPQTCV